MKSNSAPKAISVTLKQLNLSILVDVVLVLVILFLAFRLNSVTRDNDEWRAAAGKPTNPKAEYKPRTNPAIYRF